MDDGLAAAMRQAKQTVLARRASQEEQRRASLEASEGDKGGMSGEYSDPRFLGPPGEGGGSYVAAAREN